MLLNVRQNGFIILFPPNFFTERVTEKYKKYFQSLILPFDNINEFMSSTIQSIDFPGWNMATVQQTRILSKKQEFKNSIPIPDNFTREFTVTFKMTDAYLNYFIFLENSLDYLDFSNKKQVFDPIELVLMDNQGYMVSSIVFNKPLLKSQDGFKLSYSANTPDFRTFQAKFSYFDFDLKINFE